MNTILIIVVLLLLLGGGGGYFTHRAYADPIWTSGGILVPILLVLIVLWLAGVLR